jgi:hypothetical protein
VVTQNKEDIELEKLESELQDLNKNRTNNQEAIKSIEKRMTILLCPKGKNECEPAYCVFRMTNNCDFLSKWRSICVKG